MRFGEWEKTVPGAIREDTLWRMRAYKLALFLSDIGWQDATRLVKDKRTQELSDQLYRALGSISSNLAEGYSRGSGKDRARFYEYALGSARESRDWYFKGRHILGEQVAIHRMNFLAEVIKLLLTMVPQQRFTGGSLKGHSSGKADKAREAVLRYGEPPCLDSLLETVPLPSND